MLLLCCHSVDYNLKNLTKGGAYYSGGTDFGFSEGKTYAESKVTGTGKRCQTAKVPAGRPQLLLRLQKT